MYEFRRLPACSPFHVRQQVAALRCSPSPLGGSRRRRPNALLPRRHGGSRQQRACRSGLRGKALAAWLSPRVLRARQRLHSASRWWSLQRWRFSPRLQLVLTGAALNSGSLGGRSRAGASASNGKFSTGGGRSMHRSFSARCSSHRLLGSSPGSHQRLLPNPSLVGTATGKALGPRTGQCHHPSRGPSAFPASAPQLKR